MHSPLRLLVSAFGDPGHAFPAIALARELHGRGHEVTVESWGRWRDAVEQTGLSFVAAEDYVVFPDAGAGLSDPGDLAATFMSAARAAGSLGPLLPELRPDVIVSDILTLAPALAAEKAGIPRATLVPHPFPSEQGADNAPLFGVGARPPRTGLGRALWRRARPTLETGLRQGRDELNDARAVLGLPPQQRLHGGLSEQLVLVGTLPALEYPRAWPDHVHVTGPLAFELPHPDIELPAGDQPLVLVAPSTSQDPDCRLVRAALDGLADEPVRVLATLNNHTRPEPIEVPANATLVDWVSYTQALSEASLCVCHGGHGTLARSLEAGVPVLACPAAGDQTENGTRLGWSGAGLSLPGRWVHPSPLRWAVRRILGDPAFAGRAAEIGAASRANGPGTVRAAELVERLASRTQAAPSGR